MVLIILMSVSFVSLETPPLRLQSRSRRVNSSGCCRFFSFSSTFIIVLLICFSGPSSYFFFCAFSAAFVTLPEVDSLKFTDFITPTATVCRISRTANRPSGGNSWKLSTHKGLVGTKLMIAASPDFIDFGSVSVVLPVRRSHFSLISANLQAMCAVWQSKTGV